MVSRKKISRVLREHTCYRRMNRQVTNQTKQCLTTLGFISCFPQISYQSAKPPRQLSTIQGLVTPARLFTSWGATISGHGLQNYQGIKGENQSCAAYSQSLHPQRARVSSAHSPQVRTGVVAPPTCKGVGRGKHIDV